MKKFQQQLHELLHRSDAGDIESKISLGVVLSLSFAILFGGAYYDLQRFANTHIILNNYKEIIVASVEQLTLTAKGEATILALESLTAEGFTTNIRKDLPIESAILERSATNLGFMDVNLAVHPGRSANFLKEGGRIELDWDSTATDSGFQLLPRKKPTHLTICQKGQGRTMACSAVSLAAIIERAAASSIFKMEIRLIDQDSKTIAETPKFAKTENPLGVLSTPIPNTSINVVAKLPEALLSTIYINGGSWTGVAIVVILLITTIAYRFSRLSLDALANLRTIVERTGASDIELIKQSIAAAASSSNTIYFWCRDAKYVTLFGDWSYILGESRSKITIAELASGTKNPEEYSESLRASYLRRTASSQILIRRIDNEDRVFKVSWQPIEGNGTYMGLIASSHDISDDM